MAKNDGSSNPDAEMTAKKIQQAILEEINRIYSKVVIDNWQNPRNWGIMNDADGYAKVTGPCGDTMEISIKVKDNKIIKCTFDTDGCGTTIACGSIVTGIAAGKTVIQARKIDQEKMLEICGRLPDDSRHCALLAANTLQKAIDDYEMKKNEPWKRLY